MISEAVEFLSTKTALRPRIAVVLGTGLGGVEAEARAATEIPYEEIPAWPCSTAEGHAGRLVVGKLDGIDIAIACGRVHLYEGYSPRKVVFGIRVLGRWGVRSLVLTNAAGAVNPALQPGQLALISDHINLQGANPLTGPNDGTLGERFPDMTEAYSKRLRQTAKEAAQELGIPIAEGVYAAVLGPSYETPAEIRFLRTIGADLVGMSTVPEVIAARQMGMEVLALSCVTNMAAGITGEPLIHGEVLAAGGRLRGEVVKLIRAVLPALGR